MDKNGNQDKLEEGMKLAPAPGKETQQEKPHKSDSKSQKAIPEKGICRQEFEFHQPGTTNGEIHGPPGCTTAGKIQCAIRPPSGITLIVSAVQGIKLTHRTCGITFKKNTVEIKVTAPGASS